MTRKNLNCKHCGCDEFISKPNRYDIYKVIDETLVLNESPFVLDEIKLFCRVCSEELKGAVDLVAE